MFITKVCGSCTLYIVLFAVFFITGICISSVFIYFYWYFKKDNFCVKLDPIFKQQFIEYNLVEHINGKYQTN